MPQRTRTASLRARRAGLGRVARVAAGAAFVIAIPRIAHADDTAARVEELKQRGNAAMGELRTTEAVEAYRAALALAPNDATLHYNLGRAHQARGEYPEALDALRTFADRATPDVRARVPKLEALLEEVRVRVGTVSLRCSVDAPSAAIAIGDKATTRGCGKVARDVRISLPERRADLEVRFSDELLQASPVHIAVEGGGPPVAALFEPLGRTSSGVLRVRATPIGARIVVDGADRGNTPLEVPLGAGSHVVDVRADGYRSSETTVAIEAGQTRDVSVDLTRGAGLTSKWWFWTGVAVVAAGIVVTVWYVATEPESSPSRGSIAPGQITAPSSALVRF